MKRKCYSSLFISFVWQRYEKRHEKALGKAWKSGAEGESLKLLKESGAIFHFERDILAVNHYLTLTTKSFREISWGLEKEVKPLQFHLF